LALGHTEDNYLLTIPLQQLLKLPHFYKEVWLQNAKIAIAVNGSQLYGAKTRAMEDWRNDAQVDRHAEPFLRRSSCGSISRNCWSL